MSFGIHNRYFRSRIPAGNVGQLSNVWNAGQIQSTNVENDAQNDGDQIYYSEDRNLWVTGPIPYLSAATGSCAAPSYAFESDRDTGMLLKGSNHLFFAAGGDCVVGISATGVNMYPQVVGSTGTVSAPQYTFESDPDTGIYLSSVGNLGFTTGGSDALRLNSTDVTAYHQMVPSGNDTLDLGTSGTQWRNVYAATGAFSSVLIGDGGTFNVDDSGGNAIAGTATLVAGTVTVNTTRVTANSIIMISRNTIGGTPGILDLGTITPGTSFVIDSNSGTDTSTVNWFIIN